MPQGDCMIGHRSFTLVATTSLAVVLLGCDRAAPVAPILEAGTRGIGGPTVNAPSNTSATAASSSRIDVSWQDNSSNETGFEIWRSSGGAAFTRLSATGAGVTTYGDGGLDALASYCYQVRALRTYDSKISYSTFSNTACTSTLAPPPPPPPPPPSTVPAAPTLQGVSASPWGLTVWWWDNSDNEDGFKIESCVGEVCADSDFGVVATTVTSSYQPHSLQIAVGPGGVTYTFRVRAFNSVGESAPSDTGIGIECMVVIAEDGEIYCQ